MRHPDHHLCVLCGYYTSTHSLECLPPDSSIKMIEIRTWSAIEGLEELNMKKEIESKFPGISVSYGMYLCSCHVQKLPKGQSCFSKYCRPKLTTEYDGLYWSTPTSRPLPLKRILPPSPAEPLQKRPKSQEEDHLETENQELREKMKETSEKIRLLEGKLSILRNVQPNCQSILFSRRKWTQILAWSGLESLLLPPSMHWSSLTFKAIVEWNTMGSKS